MNERDALMRAICGNPDDDTPRLVFADWLQENGEDDRAEFIRAQVELARLTPEAERWNDLFGRAQVLQKKYAARWLGELPVPNNEDVDWARGPAGWVGGEAFDRGLPCRLLVMKLGTLVKHADALFRAAPVRRLMVWRLMKADKLNAIPHLRHLHTFRARVVARQAADDILACPHFDSIPDIRLSLSALPEPYRNRLLKRFGDRLRHQP